MEQELGSRLFVRNNRSVSLTHAGEQLLEFCRMILPHWQQLKSELIRENSFLRGELRLFCSVTASQSHLPPLLNHFRQQFPKVELHLITGDPAEAISKVQNKEVDLAIAIHTPNFPIELHFSYLDQVNLVLIAAKQSGIQRLSQVDWRKHAMVMPISGPSKRIVHHWFSEAGIRPRIYGSVAGNEAIVSMVALQCGLGIVPEIVLDHSVLNNQVNRIALPGIERYRVGLCCMQDRLSEPLLSALFSTVNDEQ
jgi:LysR family positive regulator for ilvC